MYICMCKYLHVYMHMSQHFCLCIPLYLNVFTGSCTRMLNCLSTRACIRCVCVCVCACGCVSGFLYIHISMYVLSFKLHVLSYLYVCFCLSFFETHAQRCMHACPFTHPNIIWFSLLPSTETERYGCTSMTSAWAWPAASQPMRWHLSKPVLFAVELLMIEILHDLIKTMLPELLTFLAYEGMQG